MRRRSDEDHLDLKLVNGVWHADGWLNGERVRRSLRTRERKRAEELRRDWLLARRPTETELSKRSATGRTVADLIRAYCEARPDLHQSSKAMLKRFAKAMGERRLGDLRDAHLEVWRRERFDGAEASPQSQARELKQLNALFKWGHEQHLLGRRLRLATPSAKSPLRVRFLTEAQRHEFVKQACLTCRASEAIILFCLHTGARPVEAARLAWGDVDLEAMHVRLVNRKGKGGQWRERHVPLNIESRRAIDIAEYLWGQGDANDAVFRRPSGKPYWVEKGEVVIPQWAKICERAGVKDFGPNDMRHTFAALLRKKGVAIDTIAELMGHEDVETTRRYAHLFREDLRRDVARLIPEPRLGHRAAARARRGAGDDGDEAVARQAG